MIRQAKTLLLIAFVVAVTIAVTGCRTAPIHNVNNAPVTASSPDLTEDDVRKAILSAGASLGWQMKQVSDNHIEGTIFLRKHMAKVDVRYSKRSYSIKYKDSKNLYYDGTKIHSNYNGWVQNLDQAIRARIVGV